MYFANFSYSTIINLILRSQLHSTQDRDVGTTCVTLGPVRESEHVPGGADVG